MCGGGGAASRAADNANQVAAKQAADAEAARQADAAREAAKQAQIQQGTSAVNTQFGSTFNDGFFNNIAQKYNDTYTPQLTDQFTSARKNLAFELANRGLTNSSAAADQYGKLQDTYNKTQQGIQDRGLQEANTQKANVASTQAGLINQANSGADLNSINSLVTSNLATLQAPHSYDPLGNIFGQLALSAIAGGVQNSSSAFNNTGAAGSAAGPAVSGASSGSGVKSYY